MPQKVIKLVLRLMGVLAALLLIAVIGLTIAGRRRDAGLNRLSIQIDKPAEQVFSWLVEEAKLKRWIGGLEQSVALTEGGPRVGAKSREVILIEGQRYDMQTEITRYEPPLHLEVRIDSAGFLVDAAYSLTETAGTTTLDYKGVATYREWFPKLMEPLVTPEAQKKLETDLNRLKRLVEAEP